MSVLPRGALVALLSIGLFLPSCALLSADPSPSDTVFRVYDLDDLYRGGLDADQTRTFESMVRDAVGEDLWFVTRSTIHSLGPVLTIRTTTEAHKRLAAFFSQFRAIAEGATPPAPTPVVAVDR